LTVKALVGVARGEWTDAELNLLEAISVGEEAGLVIAHTTVPVQLGALYRERGDVERALSLHLEAHTVAQSRAPFLLHSVEAHLAMDTFAAGEPHAGNTWLAAARSRTPRGAIARAWLCLGDLASATVRAAEANGAWDAALDQVEQGLAESRTRRLPYYLPSLYLGQALCLTALGRWDEANRSLQELLILAQANRMDAMLAKGFAALADLQRQRGVAA
jgi:tetratricopeptide (TPR) repeat protein